MKCKTWDFKILFNNKLGNGVSVVVESGKNIVITLVKNKPRKLYKNQQYYRLSKDKFDLLISNWLTMVKK